MVVKSRLLMPIRVAPELRQGESRLGMEFNQRFDSTGPAEPDKFRQAVTKHRCNKEYGVCPEHPAFHDLPFVDDEVLL